MIQKIIKTLLTACLAAVAVYMALTWYYSKSFSMNTWINGVYCTGKTIEEVNSELLEKTKAPSVIIMDREGRRYELALQDILLQLDYAVPLEKYLASQKPHLWLNRLSENTETVLNPDFTFEEERLQAFWEELSFVKEEREIESEVSIVMTKEGYTLIDTTRQRMNLQKAYEQLHAELASLLQRYVAESIESLQETEYVIDLKNLDCYEDRTLTPKQREILSRWEKVQEFQKLKIIYDMGEEQIILDASVISQFLEKDKDDLFRINEDGTLYISREKVEGFIDALAEEYDTYKKERTFQSTRGDHIVLQKGSYGTLIDREKEKEYLYKALTGRVSETHIPAYKRTAYHRGKNDIGDSYIEIDMTEQKMYLYWKGECLVNTDIVTGCTSKRMGTPEGVYSVYAMQRNRTLRGPGYASFVNYWMPVNGNIGIHDANWRNSFGGEIYKKSGSHGCINTPYEAMKIIYENVEIGIPVVMFY